MRKWALPLLLIVLQLIPLGVYAQTPLTLGSLQVQIWPEYDKPSVLVIYNMTLSGHHNIPSRGLGADSQHCWSAISGCRSPARRQAI